MRDADHTEESLVERRARGKLVAGFVRDEMSASERARFERELEADVDLRALVDEARETISLLSELPSSETSRDLAPLVLGRIPAGQWSARKTRAQWVLLFRPALIRVAAACLVVVLGVMAGRTVARRVGRGANETRDSEGTTAVAAPRLAAIEGALVWLKATQEPSGEWAATKWGGKEDFEVSLTGMSMLALLDELTAPPPSALPRSIARAVGYLQRAQKEDGSFGPECDGLMYNHGIAAVAILSAYLRSGDEQLRPSIDSALRFIRGAQAATGGWGYRNRTDREPNTSISAWQLRALMLARDAGWSDLSNSLRRGLRWLTGTIGENGSFGYRAAGDVPEGGSLTAMGAYCVYSSGTPSVIDARSASRVRSALERSAANATTGHDFYQGYFIASALKSGRHGTYDRLLLHLQEALIGQRSSVGPNRGSWDPEDKWGAAGGRVYSTAMATLALQDARPL